MIKVSVLYPNNDDVSFDFDYYRATHLPLVREKYGPYGMVFISCDEAVSKEGDQKAPYIAVTHLCFESLQGFGKAVSEQGKAVSLDVPNYTNAKPVIQVSHTDEYLLDATVNDCVKTSIDRSVLIVSIDNAPVNALSQQVRSGLNDAVSEAEANADIGALLITCEGETFIAGAEVKEFALPPMEPHLPDVVENIANCSKPVVAAIFGTTLGGGLEVAMAAHYRIAIAGSKVGLPEVSLGLIPGAGGTQLLPRLVGIDESLKMMSSGKHFPVENYVDTALIDKIVDSKLVEEGIAYCLELIENESSIQSILGCSVIKSPDDELTIEKWRTQLARKARGQIAPQFLVDAVEKSLTESYQDGQAFAREKFLECKSSPQSRAMKHAFFAERAAGKSQIKIAAEQEIEVKSVAVIGAGTMGAGIAMCFANAGYPVQMLETSQENLDSGLARVSELYEGTRKRGLISKEQKLKALSLIKGTLEYEILRNVDLVVEAAFESIEVKREIFSTLDRVCHPDCILASNTSYLDINDIAAATNRSEQVLGMHFFSPAHVMKLLEIVRADKTSDKAMVAAQKIAKAIRKTAVSVGHCYGFVGNRMYSRYGREAQMLLLQGATPKQIDDAMVAWGMVMGPLSVMDLSGIDIGAKARAGNRQRFEHDPLYFRPADLMFEKGRLGRKTEQGFYQYKDGKQQEDRLVVELISAEAERLGVDAVTNITEELIQNRLMLALISEGSAILQEGIAVKASDIDVIWLNGYGFPRFRGGPMCFADEFGLQEVVDGIRALAATEGEAYWQVPKVLIELAASGSPLADFRK